MQNYTGQITPAEHTHTEHLNHIGLKSRHSRKLPTVLQKVTALATTYKELHSSQPLNLRHRHGDELVELNLSVEAVAETRVLPACPACSLPGLGFRDPLHCQDLQTAI